jgi:RNA polymerase sigma-70 factor, ECF subfamily
MISEENHKELASKIKNGDYTAFSSLYRTYFKRFTAFAYSYLKDEFVATGIVQDVFIEFWEFREKIEIETNLPAYLLVMVKNKSLNYLNRLKIEAKVKDNIQSHALRELTLRCVTLTACDPEQMFSSDVENIIRKTLDSLPDQCRRVITMSRFDGLSNKEVAGKLGISVKAVEFHITKALKLFRHNLKDYLWIFLCMLW